MQMLLRHYHQHIIVIFTSQLTCHMVQVIRMQLKVLGLHQIGLQHSERQKELKLAERDMFYLLWLEQVQMLTLLQAFQAER